ncbi:MAG: hypothetical protein HY556_08170 [Euryarchaeota archaeon]|nr:hypothetical protein [Euryarchaeota archaeon]
MARDSAVKDIAIALAIVGGILGALYIYTGVWPPMVVVESGSMMHERTLIFHDTTVPVPGFGKVGTIDPGDMVFVQKVTKRSDIVTFAQAKDPTYSANGDVVVYYRNGAKVTPEGPQTPIIHRAYTWVDVTIANGTTAYRVEGTFKSCPPRQRSDNACTFGPEGIYIPELKMDETGSQSHLSRQSGYKPTFSGFITWGDNNPSPDQVGGISREPVKVEWIEGKARGEIPWFGLIKLALGADPNQVRNDWCHPPFTNAWAPCDLWYSLAGSAAVLAVAPASYERISHWNKMKKEGRLAPEDRGAKGALRALLKKPQ